MPPAVLERASPGVLGVLGAGAWPVVPGVLGAGARLVVLGALGAGARLVALGVLEPPHPASASAAPTAPSGIDKRERCRRVRARAGADRGRTVWVVARGRFMS
ncbi:MAG: hypothetical protein ACLP50_20310 [Solirubrobacteraceae bacterium]